MSGRFKVEKNTPIVKLDCISAFEGLNESEKKYLYWLSKASNDGALICALQTSVESPEMVVLLFKILKDEKFAVSLKTRSMTDPDINAFLIYCAAVLSNIGNYKSFGDTKIVPDISKESFEKIIQSSDSYGEVESLWVVIRDQIYELTESNSHLCYGNSTYLSHNCTQQDAETVQKCLDENDISAYNTRLRKDRANNFVVMVASIENGSAETVSVSNEVSIVTEKGDFSPLLHRVNKSLEKAKIYTKKEVEQKMLENYILSFQTGSVEDHKTGSRFWVQNKGPVVEYYIGFIENYRDPFGSRAEFEGFVAVVNKERSKKFAALVEMAPTLIEKLPWTKEFEKDKFLEPDFTSLDIITFGSSDVPSGINIPNYDDIRERDGFKNLDLGNVQNATPKNARIPFLNEENVKFLKQWKEKAWELQTALHELLGHGSGLLFNSENTPVALNPITGEAVKSFYERGETYDSKFASISSAYEECRAECVGLVLCTEIDVLTLFSYVDLNAQNDVVVMNYLQFAYDGLRSLEFYDPAKKSWGQAHMQAAFVIMQLFIEADDTAVTFEQFKDDNGEVNNVHVAFNPAKIFVCQNAVRKFLLRLQTYKSTGDIEEASRMFNYYSTPSEFLLSLREAVLANKAPRKMLILPNLAIDTNGDVQLLYDYEETPEGLIKSFVDRYKDDPEIMDDLLALGEKNKLMASSFIS
ncbi:dipeptidyl peptidase 3-like [Symsagittifera roscoffensis]|uniref:dipeptidyl peptidase 3-like n=1 Tax=Symsagittifera roscoffensis TaxID=84072 RepID=UPI00307C5152